MAHDVKIRKKCPFCKATGKMMNGLDCQQCNATGELEPTTVLEFPVSLEDMADKLNDVMNKCNDIFEKLNE
jgi:DnaJ-class molecular chaperone